jgi:septal ring factor EnvC (AmiA/AmiB activator)
LGGDIEEFERGLQQQKKKSQRLLRELNDLKIQFYEISSRNHDLEKKTKKILTISEQLKKIYGVSNISILKGP